MELISDGSISNHITKKIYQFSFEFFLPKLFPNNSNIYWKDVLWNGSYFIASCAGVTISALKKYIENQKDPE